MSMLSPLLFVLSLSIACRHSAQSDKQIQSLTDLRRDGLIGDVKAVMTDDVVLVEENDQRFEAQQASSVSIYDEAGKRTLQTPYRIGLPNGYALTQHELLFDPVEESGSLLTLNPSDKKYVARDANGNVIEKGIYDDKGRSPEAVIMYEFDSTGNWTRRIIFRLTQKDGQSALTPSEASYRHIVYFNSGAVSNDNNRGEIAAAGTKQIKSPLAPTGANLAQGQALFIQKCATCHGLDGKSQTPFASVMTVRPTDLTSVKTQALSEGEIYSIIENGVKSRGMPAFNGRISDESKWQIALYVRKLSRAPSSTGETAVAAAPVASPSQTAPAVTERRYQLKGKVVAIQIEAKEVTIEHEEIPGYMGAMTMPFPLRDEKTLGKIKKDDRIRATLVVDRKGWRLENVVVE
jgi:mono/diheme cytochrome c family protein